VHHQDMSNALCQPRSNARSSNPRGSIRTKANEQLQEGMGR